MLNELIVVFAVRQVAVIRAVMIQTSERWGINRKMDFFVRECCHCFDTVGIIDRVFVRDVLRVYSHAGILSFSVK